MSGELYIGTRGTTGGGRLAFIVSEKPTGEHIEVCIGDVPTLDPVEIKALLLHIAEKIVADGMAELHKQAHSQKRAKLAVVAGGR